MLMMKDLLLLNVNNTVLHFCLSKRRSKRVKITKMGQKGAKEVNKGQKSYHRSRKWVKTQVKKGQKSYQKGGLTKNGSKRRSKRVKDLRELLMLTENP